jgi:hypothetical protein
VRVDFFRAPVTDDPGVVRANTCAKSAYGAFVVHCFRPFGTHSSPSLSAAVFILGASEPTMCSVNAKAVDFSLVPLHEWDGEEPPEPECGVPTGYRCVSPGFRSPSSPLRYVHRRGHRRSPQWSSTFPCRNASRGRNADESPAGRDPF